MKKTAKKKNLIQNGTQTAICAKSLVYPVVDTKNNVFVFMDALSIAEQKLTHRKCITALFTHEHLLLLCKQKRDEAKKNTSMWGLFQGKVQAFEADYDAALRLCGKIITPLPAELHCVEHATPDENDASFRTLFTGKLTRTFRTYLLTQPEVIWAVDADEFKGLTATAPELFTQELLFAAPYIFSLFQKKENNASSEKT